MTIRFANFKTVAGVAVIGGMLSAGALGLAGTAQADTGSPAKPTNPGVASDTGGSKGLFGGLSGVGAPTVASASATPGFPWTGWPTISLPKAPTTGFPITGWPTICGSGPCTPSTTPKIPPSLFGGVPHITAPQILGG